MSTGICILTRFTGKLKFDDNRHRVSEPELVSLRTNAITKLASWVRVRSCLWCFLSGDAFVLKLLRVSCQNPIFPLTGAIYITRSLRSTGIVALSVMTFSLSDSGSPNSVAVYFSVSSSLLRTKGYIIAFTSLCPTCRALTGSCINQGAKYPWGWTTWML